MGGNRCTRYENIIVKIENFGPSRAQANSSLFSYQRIYRSSFNRTRYILPVKELHVYTRQQQLDSWNYNHLLFFCLRFFGPRHYILFIKYICIYVVLTIIIYSLMHDRAIFQLKHPSMHKSQREIQVVSKSTSSSRVLFL